MDILNQLNSGVSRKELYKQFNCSPATISRIVQNQTGINNIAQLGKEGEKERLRLSLEVGSALAFWCNQQKAMGRYISEKILLEKAQLLARELNTEFVPKRGWFERWKRREKIQMDIPRDGEMNRDFMDLFNFIDLCICIFMVSYFIL